MKKINLFLLIAILVFTSCGNSTKEFTEIGETVKKFHLAPLVANIEDIYVKKVKDKKGREQEVVYKLNADCKFAYDLTKINFDAKNKILTLPTCEVTVSPDYSGDGPKYISGGKGLLPHVKSGNEEAAFGYRRSCRAVRMLNDHNVCSPAR